MERCTRRSPRSSESADGRRDKPFRNLSGIRQKWALWLTVGIERELQNFERVILKIGSQAHLLRVVPDLDDRQGTVGAMFALLSEVMELDKPDDQSISQEYAITNVIAKLRKVLGIEKLTALRTKLVADATSSQK